jgi:nitroimidazol reductase NimA-like FMN-containing flavoprotein (pyridoxamine 5'-phosphate oxidase superfamily)
MVIREMSNEDCLRVLARARLARLACAKENQPYVVPVYVVYHEPFAGEACLYGFTVPGQKVEWMRANPRVCVEVDEVAAYDQWMSVVASGRYEEFPETQGCDEERFCAAEHPRQAAEAPQTGASRPAAEGDEDERSRAWRVLKTHPVWWEPGCAAWAACGCRDSGEPFHPIFYRVRIDRVTGRKATRDARDALSYAVPVPPGGIGRWLRKTLTRTFGGPRKAGTVT